MPPSARPLIIEWVKKKFVYLTWLRAIAHVDFSNTSKVFFIHCFDLLMILFSDHTTSIYDYKVTSRNVSFTSGRNGFSLRVDSRNMKIDIYLSFSTNLQRNLSTLCAAHTSWHDTWYFFFNWTIPHFAILLSPVPMNPGFTDASPDVLNSHGRPDVLTLLCLIAAAENDWSRTHISVWVCYK